MPALTWISLSPSLQRLSTANDEIVEVLLSKHQVLAALRFIRGIGGHDNISARKFLDAAKQTEDHMLFYTIFRFFEQRNQRLRGNPGFTPGEAPGAGEELRQPKAPTATGAHWHLRGWRVGPEKPVWRILGFVFKQHLLPAHVIVSLLLLVASGFRVLMASKFCSVPGPGCVCGGMGGCGPGPALTSIWSWNVPF